MQTLTRLSLPLVALSIVLLPLSRFNARPAAAQEAGGQSGPLMVVVYSGVDALTGDVGKLMTAVGGAGDAAAMQSFLPMVTAGIDRKRPAGAIVNAVEGNLQWLGFVPVTSLDALLSSPFIKLAIGEPKALGGGVQQIAPKDGPPLFIKEQGGWAYLASSPDALATLPADPLPLLGGLEKQYDLAARVHLQRLPAAMREALLTQVADVSRLAGAGPRGLGGTGGLGVISDPFAATRKVNLADLLAGALNQIDELTVGLAIDGDAPNANFDITVVATEGSDLARRIAALSGAKSEHAGLLLPEFTGALHLAIPLTDDDAKSLAAAIEELESPADATPEQKESEELGRRMLAAAVRSAKLDGGFAVVAKRGASAVVYGGKGGDAATLRATMIDIIRKAQQRGGLPKEHFERIDYHGYRFVIVKGIKAPPDDKTSNVERPTSNVLKKICGDELEMAFALKDSDHYLAVGQQTVALLKRVIDASEAGVNNPAAPATLAVDVRAVLAAVQEFGPPDTIDPKLAEKLNGLSGPDRVLLRLSPQGGGATLRLEIEKMPLLAIVLAVQDQVKGAVGGGGLGGIGAPF